MTPVEALQWIGECDARLQRWAESLPLDLQPGIDGAPDNGVLPFAARIACPYYLACVVRFDRAHKQLIETFRLMTLHRLSLFDEGTLITPHLSDPSLKPYLGRLRASGSICAQAARAVLTTFERLAHQFPADKMWTVHIVLSAILVLSLRIWRNPTSMSSRADLQVRPISPFVTWIRLTKIRIIVHSKCDRVCSTKVPRVPIQRKLHRLASETVRKDCVQGREPFASFPSWIETVVAASWRVEHFSDSKRRSDGFEQREFGQRANVDRRHDQRRPVVPRFGSDSGNRVEWALVDYCSSL